MLLQATQALKEEQAKQPSKEELVEKCICEQRANSGHYAPYLIDPYPMPYLIRLTGDPCTDSGLDNSQEKKLRADIDASCAQELAQMPGAMKDQMKNECVKRRTESAGLEFKDPEEEEAKEAARKYIQDTCERKVSTSDSVHSYPGY